MKKMMIVIYLIIACLSFAGMVHFEKVFEIATMKIPDENIYPDSTKMEIYSICEDIFGAWLAGSTFSLLVFIFLLYRKFFCDMEALRQYFLITLLAIFFFPLLDMVSSWFFVFIEEVVLL